MMLLFSLKEVNEKVLRRKVWVTMNLRNLTCMGFDRGILFDHLDWFPHSDAETFYNNIENGPEKDIKQTINVLPARSW